jgi:hypothetical protein
MGRGLAAATVVISLLTLLAVGVLLVRSAAIENRLAEAELAVRDLEAEVAALERGVPLSELSLRMAELENEIQEWVLAFSGDVETPASGTTAPTDPGAVLTRLTELQRDVDRLHERLVEICEGVPVC